MKKHLLLVLISVTLLFGCANLNKEQVGTVGGAVAGGVIGNKVGGTKGALIGAVLGGLIGNRLGAHLDEQDKQKLAELELKSLETGNSESFVTNKTKATVTVTPQPVQFEQKQNFALSSAIKTHPLLMVDPADVIAYVDTPVFSDIDEKSSPRMVIQKGVSLHIPASVVGQQWAVVGDSNVGIGYVPLRYLKPEIQKELAKTTLLAETKTVKSAGKKQSQKTASKTAEKPVVTPPAKASVNVTDKVQYEKELSKLNTAYKSGSATTSDASNQPASAVKVVQMATECKVVTRKVDTGNESGSFTESVKYCKEPPKGWKTQTV